MGLAKNVRRLLSRGIIRGGEAMARRLRGRKQHDGLSSGGHGRRAVGHRQAKRRSGRLPLNPAGTAFAWAGRAAGSTRQRFSVHNAITLVFPRGPRSRDSGSTYRRAIGEDFKSFKPKHDEDEEEEDRGESSCQLVEPSLSGSRRGGREG